MARRKKQLLVTMPKDMTAERAQKELGQLYEELHRLTDQEYEIKCRLEVLRPAIELASARHNVFRLIKNTSESATKLLTTRLLTKLGLTPDQIQSQIQEEEDKMLANNLAEYPEPDPETDPVTLALSTVVKEG